MFSVRFSNNYSRVLTVILMLGLTTFPNGCSGIACYHCPDLDIDNKEYCRLNDGMPLNPQPQPFKIDYSKIPTRDCGDSDDLCFKSKDKQYAKLRCVPSSVLECFRKYYPNQEQGCYDLTTLDLDSRKELEDCTLKGGHISLKYAIKDQSCICKSNYCNRDLNSPSKIIKCHSCRSGPQCDALVDCPNEYCETRGEPGKNVSYKGCAGPELWAKCVMEAGDEGCYENQGRENISRWCSEKHGFDPYASPDSLKNDKPERVCICKGDLCNGAGLPNKTVKPSPNPNSATWSRTSLLPGASCLCLLIAFPHFRDFFATFKLTL